MPKENKVTYIENGEDIDSKFINDQTWLIFPFHFVSVIYPDTGGYTPGDIHELFLDGEYMITKCIYRRDGSEIPTRISSWDDNIRVWFTDVPVAIN